MQTKPQVSGQLGGALPPRQFGQNRSRSSRRGSALALILFLAIMILTWGAFAVNVAQLQLVRTELQVASDASARAANRLFANTRDLAAAQAQAQLVANQNRVNGRTLVLRPEDFELGTSTRNNLSQRYQYTPGGPHPNSIQLRTRMAADSASGPVRLFLPGFLGVNTANANMVARSTQVELDIALVIDRSGSMAFRADQVASLPGGWTGGAPLPNGFQFGHPAPNPSRWRDTVAGVQVFLNELNLTAQLEHVTLVTYSNGATIDRVPTPNYADLMSSLNVYTNSFQSGHTNIGGGLRSAGNALVHANARPWAVKVIVLMTDGIENTGPNSVSEARRLASEGIMIFTVTFAQEANQTRMRQVAGAGGGNHYHANDAASLSRVFRDIARKMPTLVTR